MQLDGVVKERRPATNGPLNSELARLRAESDHFDQRMKDLAAGTADHQPARSATSA
jgi:hypothetical protein